MKRSAVSKKMKLAIVVGHTRESSGAVMVTDGTREWSWNKHLAMLIQSHDPDNIKIFYRVKPGGYSVEIDRVYDQVNKWGATATFELHFNSLLGSKATGTETLTSGTTGSLKLANLVQAEMVRAIGLADRGLKQRGRKDRGGRSLWQGKSPCAMLEPFFGSNAKDCAAIEHSKDELAEGIYRAARKFHE